MATDSLSTQDEYLLNRSYAASARLNLQHYLWMSSASHQLLHPAVPVANEHLTVADIGTGTGIWLLDLARQHPPTAQFDGLDISLDQAPPKERLPANVSFRSYDVYEPPPEDLVEKYDVVHVRHLTLVVKENDPTPILQILLKILKPGGFLQWGEYDLRNRRTDTIQPECSTAEMKGLQQRMQDFLHTPNTSWPKQLGQTFERAGLQNISFEGNWIDRSYLGFQQDVSLLVYEELIDMIARRQGTTKEQIRELRMRLDKAAGESRRGAAWNIEILVAVGQKQAQKAIQ